MSRTTTPPSFGAGRWGKLWFGMLCYPMGTVGHLLHTSTQNGGPMGHGNPQTHAKCTIATAAAANIRVLVCVRRGYNAPANGPPKMEPVAFALLRFGLL